MNISTTLTEVTNALNVKKAFEYNVLPLKVKDGKLYIGMSNLNDFRVIKDLNFETGYDIVPVEMAADIILERLRELYPAQNGSGTGNQEQVKNSMISEHSNVEFVNQIIYNAVKSNVSDIHFEVFENHLRIRYRIDGHLREILSLPKSKFAGISSRIKVLSNLDISEKRRPQDGRIRFLFETRNIDIRVSCLPTSFGEKIVLRILDKAQLNLDLRNLGMSIEQFEIIERNIFKPYGMILVTGPTGSGKTTSLYAALKEINSIEKNILTIEDPIEYNLNGINQSNVKHDIGFDFAAALRSFLRQDPDIIMIGEIRDKETAEIAIRASLTGHLVLSTLHTNDSISAITRLIDMGIEPFLISASLKLIIAQRLVRTLCKCKKESNKHYKINEFLDSTIYDTEGCPDCSYAGYSGRTALFELLEVKETMAELISNDFSVGRMRDLAKENGFISLRETGLHLVKAGITTYEEVMRETLI